MKKWYYHIADDGRKRLIEVVNTYKKGNREFVEYIGDGPEISIHRCKKLTRHEVMLIAQKEINKIADSFGVWINADYSADGAWPVIMCKKSNKKISI